MKLHLGKDCRRNASYNIVAGACFDEHFKLTWPIERPGLVKILPDMVCWAGLRSFTWSYHQRGVVASLRTQLANTTAWQRFLPSGPLALLPVRDGYSNIVWSTTSHHALELEKASPQEFALAVNEVKFSSFPSAAAVSDGT